MAGFILVVGFSLFLIVLALVFVVVGLYVERLAVLSVSCAFVHVFSLCVSSSGVMPAVSPVWLRVGRTAAAVPEVTAFRKECVLSTQSAQTVSQPAPSPRTYWPAAPE